MLSHPVIDSALQSGRRRLEPVVARARRNTVVMLAVRTFQELTADDATHMAAGVAYYAFFSLFPLLLGLIAFLSLFLDSAAVRESFIEFVVFYLPGSEDFISANIEAVLQLRGALGILAIVGLFWSGSAIFGAITRAVNRAWDVHRDRPIYISKPRQMAMALGVGALFVLSLSTAGFVRLAEELRRFEVPALDFLANILGLVILQGSSFFFTLCIFLLIYKFLPNTKTCWRYIWPGALVAAVLFELGKNLFLLYLNRFASFESIYGSLAPVVVLLLWTYVSSFILILGAEISSEFGRLRQGVERGQLLHTAAARASREGQ